MRCPKCGTELPEEALFCANCGAPMEKASEPSPQKQNLNEIWSNIVAENAAEEAAESQTSPSTADEAPRPAGDGAAVIQPKKEFFLFRCDSSLLVLTGIIIMLAIPLSAAFSVISYQTNLFPLGVSELVLVMLMTLSVFIPKSRVPGVVYLFYFMYCFLLGTELYQIILTGNADSFVETWASRTIWQNLASGLEIAIYMLLVVLMLVLTFRPSKAMSLITAGAGVLNIGFQIYSFTVFVVRVVRFAAQYSTSAWRMMGGYFFFWHTIIMILVTVSLVLFALTHRTHNSLHPKEVLNK